jgi:ferredoxin
MMDSAYPDRGYALRWCEQAREMYKADRHTKEARSLLRDALSCSTVVDYASVYRSWIAMELDDGNVEAARDLYEEWKRRQDAGEDSSSVVDFWCAYINFEVENVKNGKAGLARAVAKEAVEACPGDPTIYAKSLNVKLRFGDGDPAPGVAERAVKACPSETTIYAMILKVKLLFGRGNSVRRLRLRRHLDNFAMDVDCKDWLVHYQVGACHDDDDDDSKAKQLAGGFLLDRMRRGVSRLVQPHGYQRLHSV